MRQAATALLFMSAPAMAQPMGCDQLAKTKIPFQLTTKNHEGTRKDSQVYRSERGYRTTLEQDGSSIRKTVFQNIYLRHQYVGEERTFTVDWGVPTDKAYASIPDQIEYDSTMTIGDRKEIARHKFRKEGKDELFVGPCMFEVVRYSVSQTSKNWTNDKQRDTTIWFSDNLSSILRIKTIIQKSDGSQAERSSEVVGITTDFAPYK